MNEVHRSAMRSDPARKAPACEEAPPVNLDDAGLVERHHAEWFLAERVVRGVEVHQDRDLTWIVHPGQAWRNAGIVEHVCQEATRSRARRIVLLASSEGQRLYSQRGFVEVARFGYWYRSFQRFR